MSQYIVQILLIDRELHDYQVFKDILDQISTFQVNLIWVKNYAEGLENTINNQADIYLIDRALDPDSSAGLQLLKESRKKGCDRPIFILTESELKSREIEAITAAGATDYFDKSELNVTLLEHSIRYALKEQQINQALRLSEQRYALALSAGEVGVWDWDIKNNQLYVATNLKAMLGYTNNEINPNWEEWQQLVHPDDRERVKVVLENHLAGLTSQYEVEYRRLHKDGTWRWFLSRGDTLRDSNGQPCRMAGSETDITERKQLEAYLRQSLENEKEINYLKSRFLTMVSHEFRTPLATILSSADLLEFYIEQFQKENALNHVERLQSAAEYMTQMLNDVLLMEDAKTGNLNFNPVWLDLCEFSQQFVKNLKFSINRTKVIAENKKHQIDVLIHLNNNLEETHIHGLFDKDLMKQILNHLLWNAIKYSPQGGAVILEIDATDDAEIILQVKDRGIGIPTAEQTQIFEMFYRGNNIENIPGSGLGLSIVKSCVYLHGGDMSVQSTVGVGSTFTVKLPWHKSQDSYQEYFSHLTDVEIMNTDLHITKVEHQSDSW
jgi:PAS domain S-box-containing protein